MSSMFQYCAALTSLDVPNWTTSKVEVKERDGEWYITEETLNDFMKRYKDKMVVKCWANGGYG
jgi:surface protein